MMNQNNPTTILRCLRLSLLSLSLLVSVALGQASGELLAQPSTQQPPTFTPKSTFLAPAKLMDYWGDTPIPLSAYTEQELAMQRLLDQQEAAVIAYAPQKEEVFRASSEMDLPGQNGLVDALEITPYTWKWVELEMRRSAGNLPPTGARIRLRHSCLPSPVFDLSPPATCPA